MLQAVDNLDAMSKTKQLTNVQDVTYDNVKIHDPWTTYGITIVFICVKRWLGVSTGFVYTAGENVSLHM
jgi:hypothetical protein